MPQSLLALFGILAISTLVLQTSRDRMSDLDASYRNEAEVQARGVAVEVLERLSGVAFDGGEGGDASGTGTAVLSPRASFGSSADTTGQPMETLFSSAGLDDLDDFDGVTGAVATVSVVDPESGTAQSLDLTVAIEVVYVEQDAAGNWGPAASAATRTPFKRAMVSVDHSSFAEPARLGRIYVAS
jgi:hypothetical protein